MPNCTHCVALLGYYVGSPCVRACFYHAATSFTLSVMVHRTPHLVFVCGMLWQWRLLQQQLLCCVRTRRLSLSHRGTYRAKASAVATATATAVPLLNHRSSVCTYNTYNSSRRSNSIPSTWYTRRRPIPTRETHYRWYCCTCSLLVVVNPPHARRALMIALLVMCAAVRASSKHLLAE